MNKKVMLYIGPWDENQEGSFFSWSPSFVKGFSKLGWDVSLFPYRLIHHQDIIFRLSRNRLRFSAIKTLERAFYKKCSEVIPDVIFIEKGELISPEWLEYVKEFNNSPLIVYSTFEDPHLFTELGRVMSGVADVVLTSSEMCVPMYKDMGIQHVQYMPFWGIPDKEHPFTGEVPEQFKCDIAFLGSYYHPERGILLDALVDPLLENNISLKIWGKGWEKAPKRVRDEFWTGSFLSTEDYRLRYVFHGCKIALNIHHAWMKYGMQKSNLRQYEALASGAFVLTDRTSGIEDLFKVGEELVCYDSASDLTNKIKYYLDRPKERQKIAAQGYSVLKKEYSLDCWVKKADEITREALIEKE